MDAGPLSVLEGAFFFRFGGIWGVYGFGWMLFQQCWADLVNGELWTELMVLMMTGLETYSEYQGDAWSAGLLNKVREKDSSAYF